MQKCKHPLKKPHLYKGTQLTTTNSYHKNPTWIKLILIRKATDIAAIGIDEKNEPSRFEKAFENVPKEAWYVFEKPEECYEVIRRTVGASV